MVDETPHKPSTLGNGLIFSSSPNDDLPEKCSKCGETNPAVAATTLVRIAEEFIATAGVTLPILLDVKLDRSVSIARAEKGGIGSITPGKLRARMGR
jgi:hypothetical protein